MEPRLAPAAQRNHSPNLSGTWARIRTSPVWIVGIAILLRVGWIVVGHTYKFKSADNNFGFGWEMGRIGASLASGHGFSSPFGAETGPTAWEPPLYPYLIAGVFQVFGIYSKASAFVLLTINSVFSALTCIPIFLIARRIFSEEGCSLVSVGLGSPAQRHVLVYEVGLGDEPVGAFVGRSRLAGSDSRRAGWVVAMGAVRVALGRCRLEQHRRCFRFYRQLDCMRGTGARNAESVHWRGVVLASTVFFACIAPWLVRNYQTFGQFIFIRDNFGAELRLGNGKGADGTWMEYLHPTQDVYAMRQYQAMGELAYIAMRKRQALDYIKADYFRFAGLCAKRFVYYWGGAPKATRPWWMNDVKNSLFLASSVLMILGIGPGAAPAETGRVAAVLADAAVSGSVLRRVSQSSLPGSD